MKYAAVVLFNKYNPVAVVEYAPVTDAFVAGGVFLEEIDFLPYDAPGAVNSALLRLSMDMDGVFIICDPVLLASARRSLESAAEKQFEEEYLLETERCLFGVIPTGERGAEEVRTEAVPRIDARRKNSFLRVVIRTVSAPAERLRSALNLAREAAGGALTVHATEKYGAACIELIYDRVTPKMTADEVARILATELADYIYTLGDETIAERLVEALKVRRMKISVAESFTGGGVGRAIVRVPGASEVYFEGLNTYDARAKAARLHVSESTLSGKGTVSDETAYEMAAGLLESGNCDLAVATTGVAGPKPDEKNNPPGLCYIAVGTKERVNVYRYQLSGRREAITETAVNYALFLAYREIK